MATPPSMPHPGRVGHNFDRCINYTHYTLQLTSMEDSKRYLNSRLIIIICKFGVGTYKNSEVGKDYREVPASQFL